MSYLDISFTIGNIPQFLFTYFFYNGSNERLSYYFLSSRINIINNAIICLGMIHHTIMHFYRKYYILTLDWSTSFGTFQSKIRNVLKYISQSTLLIRVLLLGSRVSQSGMSKYALICKMCVNYCCSELLSPILQLSDIYFLLSIVQHWTPTPIYFH